MDSLDTIEEFRKVNASFPYTEPVKAWKNQGKKVIGWICNYVPEEIIHAAGMLPFRITGDSKEIEMPDGDAYLHIYSCSYTRSCCQLAAEGQLGFLDGFAATAMCDGSRRLADVLDHYGFVPCISTIGVPRKFDESAEGLYRREILQFKQEIENFVKTEISNESLRDSIEVYNRSRQLLKELYEIRRLDSPPITGAETLEVLNACMRMPREEFTAALERLLAELKGGRETPEWRARLMLNGSILQNVEFVKGIEELGGLIVTDALCNGARYWEGVVDTTMDPIPALVDYYLRKFPCPRFYPPKVNNDKVLDLVEEYRVEGVIYNIIRYCNNHAWDYPILKARLEEKGIPILQLDVEYGMGATGQIKTRAQAFIEMLEERRGAK
ncbi:MAG: 2-hydroxyacyl-CoA dehydratase family protein [Pseudomonadota bacterium]